MGACQNIFKRHKDDERYLYKCAEMLNMLYTPLTEEIAISWGGRGC